MLRIVTSNNGEVFRHLGSAPFRRVEVEQHTATSGAALIDLVRRLRPDMVLLDAELNGGESGFDVCSAIKHDAELARTHVIQLLTEAVTRAQLDAIERARCDDVVALPISSDDFYHHIAQLVGLSIRRAPRVGIELETSLHDRVESITGTVINLTASGMGVRVQGGLLATGQVVTVRLHRGAIACETPARVAWTRASDPPELGQVAGLELRGEIPIGARLLLEELSLYDVVPAGPDSGLPGGVVVIMQGDLTEAVDFAGLRQAVGDQPRIVFDTAGLRYMSSAGVKAWCELIDGLGAAEYCFRHCSLAFASQAAMVPMVLGTGRVLSLEAPYHCESCQRDDLRLLETGAVLRDGAEIIPPCLRCVECGAKLEFDDVPNRYFAFLRGHG
jgi:CheY-like chemotaxis protein